MGLAPCSSSQHPTASGGGPTRAVCARRSAHLVAAHEALRDAAVARVQAAHRGVFTVACMEDAEKNISHLAVYTGHNTFGGYEESASEFWETNPRLARELCRDVAPSVSSYGRSWRACT